MVSTKAPVGVVDQAQFDLLCHGQKQILRLRPLLDATGVHKTDLTAIREDATGFGTPRIGCYLADVSVPAGSPTALRYSITSDGMQIFSSKI